MFMLLKKRFSVMKANVNSTIVLEWVVKGLLTEVVDHSKELEPLVRSSLSLIFDRIAFFYVMSS